MMPAITPPRAMTRPRGTAARATPCLLLALLLAPQAAQADLPSALDLALRAIVPVYSEPANPSRVCTAFAARPFAISALLQRPVSAIFLTAGHCMLASRLVLRPLSYAWEVPVPLAASAIPGRDLGVFAAIEWRADPVYLPLLPRPLKDGEPVAIAGYGAGLLTIIRGSVSGDDAATGDIAIRTAAPIRGGMSGSPVVTADGFLAGILVATRADGPSEDPTAALATPAAAIRAALQSLRAAGPEPGPGSFTGEPPAGTLAPWTWR